MLRLKKLTGTFLSLLIFSIFLMSFISFVPVNASSWLSGYEYRVEITISDPYTLAGTNYQIPIGVKYDSDVFSLSPDRYFGNPFDLPEDDVGYGATHPTVMYFPTAVDGYKFWMWYENGGSYTNETDVDIYLVRSNNGIDWVETGVSNPVLDTSEVTYGSHDPHVIWVSNTDWRMWWGSRHSNSTWTIGYGTSTDGKDFTIVDSQVLIGTEAWEVYAVFCPTIIYDSGTFNMMYTGLNATWASKGQPKIGYATSTDGITWTKYASNPVLSPTKTWEKDGIWHHNIVEYNDKYMFIYSGYPAPTPAEGFGVAQSDDFITWTKSGYDPFMYITTEWENARLYTPSPLRYASNQSLVFFNEGHGNFMYMYYSANTDIGSVVHKIGLATELRLGYYDLEGHSQTDFDDVVFTSSNGLTLLDHYKEMVNTSWSITPNEWCIKWVEISHNLNTSDATIYMYWGNPSATDSSNGTATFPYFDDFIGDTIGTDWNSQGTPDMSPTGDGDDTWIQFLDDDDIYSTTTFGFGYAVKVKTTANEQDTVFVKFSSSHVTAAEDLIDIINSDGSAPNDLDQYQVRCLYDFGVGGDYTNLDADNFDTMNEPPWHTFEIQRNMTNNIVYYQQDDNYMDNITTNIPPNSLGIGMGVWDDSQESTMTCDWIFIRKFVSPEPTITFGDSAFRVVSITNMEGCGNWVFADAGYYEFNVSFSYDLGADLFDEIQIGFTDGYNLINMTYDHVNAEWSLDSGSDVVNLADGEALEVGNNLFVTFLVYFKNTIVDALNVDIHGRATTTDDSDTGWCELIIDYFHIYNLGGLSALSTSGIAGRTTGGDWMELYAEANSWALSNITYRKLQGYEFLIGINWDGESDNEDGAWEARDAGYIAFGMDYCYDDEWINGWYVNLSLRFNDFGTNGRWLKTRVEWYNREALVKTDYIVGYWEGVDDENDQIRYHIKLWFNKENASTVIGGMITPFYYGMCKQTWITRTWSPYHGQPYADNPDPNTNESLSSSSFFNTLYDGDDDVLSASQIDFMRPWTLVNRYNLNTSIYSILHPEQANMHLLSVGQEMSGMDTPPFIEPSEPEMPQTGPFSFIARAITTLSNVISLGLTIGALSFWVVFVNFLDTIAGTFGFPGAFTTFIEYLTNFFTWMIDGMGWIYTMFTNMFLFFTVTMTSIMTHFVNTITGFINMWNAFITVITDGFSSGVNIVTFFTPFLEVLPIIYVIYLFFLWADHGEEALFNHLSMVTSILAFIINLFITILQTFIMIIGRIIETVPIIE